MLVRFNAANVIVVDDDVAVADNDDDEVFSFSVCAYVFVC